MRAFILSEEVAGYSVGTVESSRANLLLPVSWEKTLVLIEK